MILHSTKWHLVMAFAGIISESALAIENTQWSCSASSNQAPREWRAVTLTLESQGTADFLDQYCYARTSFPECTTYHAPIVESKIEDDTITFTAETEGKERVVMGVLDLKPWAPTLELSATGKPFVGDNFTHLSCTRR